MKMVTQAHLLRDALRLAGPVVRRADVPVLAAVLLDGPRLRATDLDVELEVTVPVTASSGRAAIAWRPLMQLLAHVPGDDTVTIEAGKSGATVAFSCGRYDLPTFQPGDFPEGFAGERAAGRRVPIDGPALQAAFRFVRHAICTEETRYYLTGACLDGGDIVATDGHRLAVHPANFDTAPFERAIVPTRIVDLVTRLPPATACRLGKGVVGLDLPGVRLTGKLIDGAFPDWRRVVPAPAPEEGGTLTVGRQALGQALKRLRAVLRERHAGVTLAGEGDHVVLVAGPPELKGRIDARGREIVRGAALAGAMAPTGFMADYLADIVKTFRGEGPLTVRWTGAGDPATWQGDGAPRIVLMPMRHDGGELAVATLAEAQRAAAAPAAAQERAA